MRFSEKVGLALACLLAGFLSQPQVTAADVASQAAVRDALATRVYATAREIDASRSAGSPLASDLSVRVATLRGAVDGMATSTDAPAKRKALALAPLVAALEHAIAAPAKTGVSLLPSRLPASRRFEAGLLGGSRNGSCESALGFGADREIDGTMSAGGEVWLRFDAAGPALYRVGTGATPLDTEIAVFAQCPKSADAKPLASSDDAFGLAASAPIDLRTVPGPRWLRVRNLGSAGAVAIIAGTAGTISGRVTDIHSGLALANTAITAYTAEELTYGGSTYSDEDGNYLLVAAPDDYYVFAMAQGYVGEVWPDGPCPYQAPLEECAFEDAQPVTVTAGDTTSGVDFALTTGARISGRAVDRTNGLPVVNGQISVYDAENRLEGQAITDAAGRYQVSGLAPGTFHVLAQSFGYLGQAYFDLDCPQFQFCDPALGTPIVLDDLGSFDAADFHLAPLLSLMVTINLADGAQTFDSPLVSIVTPDGTPVASTYAVVGQPWQIGPVVPGSYYVYTDLVGYFSQLFDHVDCAADCASDLAEGTLISISSVEDLPQLTFDLNPTPTITGRITDADTGAGLGGVLVELWPVDGEFMTQAVNTDADGSYRVGGATPDTYYVIARSTDHQDMAYPDAPCSDRDVYNISACAISMAEPVTLDYSGGDVVGIDLALPLNATVEGTVRFRVNGGTGDTIANASVGVYDTSGIALAYAQTNADGRYSLGDLVAGTYYLEASAFSYFSEIYAGIDCPLIGQDCSPIIGTPIVLAQGQTLDTVDFDLVGADLIVGRVTDALTGAGLASVAIDTWNSTDDTHCGVTTTNADGYYVAGDTVAFCNGPARKVSTDAGDGFIDQVFDGIACPDGPAYLGLCPLDAATLLTIPPSVVQPVEADFVLQRGDAIFADSFE